jgi:hypothetical protein
MASKRNKRADEITPKLHYRPGVVDPDLEATIVGFYSSEKVPIPFPTSAGGPPFEQADTVCPTPTVGTKPTAGLEPTVSPRADEGQLTQAQLGAPLVVRPTAGTEPPVGLEDFSQPIPTVGRTPAAAIVPTVGSIPTVGIRRKIKPLIEVQDALTLAGNVLYKAMYGSPDGNPSKICRKGYRQLASDAHLDKDTVRDLIVDFKAKGIVTEVGSYDPDTRSAKTYEVLSYRAILQLWREAGIHYVIPGRKPIFCNAVGEAIWFTPTVGLAPTVGARPTQEAVGPTPTVGIQPAVPGGLEPTGALGSSPTPLEKEVKNQQTTAAVIVEALQETMGRSDDDAANQILRSCRQVTPDITDEEIARFIRQEGPALRRNRALDNPMGVLIRHIPRCCRGEALRLHREAMRLEQERNRQQVGEWVQDARNILAKPDATAMDRAWAEDILVTYASREGKG